MRYYVVSDDGNKYGPADITTLNSWIQEGRLVPTTLLEEEGSGARVAASAVSGLAFPQARVQPGPVSAPGPGPGAPGFANPPGPANPYSAGYANSYQAVPEGGNTEVIIAFICAALGLFCCFGFSIVGLILAIVGKNKGNRNGTAALVCNIVSLAISIILAFVMLPTFMKSFNDQMQTQQMKQNSGPPPSFTPPSP